MVLFSTVSPIVSASISSRMTASQATRRHGPPIFERPDNLSCRSVSPGSDGTRGMRASIDRCGAVAKDLSPTTCRDRQKAASHEHDAVRVRQDLSLCDTMEEDPMAVVHD